MKKTMKKNMKKTLLIILFLQLFLDAYPIYFRHIGMKEGLSQLSVMAIYQDSLGRMWFGTEEGLNIYDGVKTIAYKPSDYRTSGNFIIGNRIHYIIGDKQGNVYFNSDNSLIFYDIHSQQFSCLKSSRVYALASYKDELWAGIADSVCTLEPRTGKARFKAKLPTTGHNATSILIDNKARCWIGTNDGLFRKEQAEPLAAIIPHIEVYQLFEDSRHNIWISTRTSGMYKYSPQGTITSYTCLPQQPAGLADMQVRGFAEDNYGNIWIGTFRGLNKYNPNNDTFSTYTHSNEPGSLSHNSVFPVYKDRQGSIWLGTYFGGINYFNPEADLFTLYSADTGREDCLSYPFVGHMVEDKDNNVWICTEGGGLNFFDRKTRKFTHYLMNQEPNSVAHNNLKDILYDPKRQKLYIGTHTGGISIYNIRTKKFSNPYRLHPELSARMGDRIAQMQLWGDTLVFCTERGMARMNVDTEQFAPLFASQKYYGNTCFLKDTKGYIWIASATGVYRINLKNEADQHHYAANSMGLGHFAITKMIEDPKGRIFLGTKGSGLFCFDKQQFKGYSTENSGIAGNYCYELALLAQGQLIISGDKGLSFFDPQQQSFKIVELGAALPLTGINMGCGVLVCQNGEIFVGGTSGLTSFFEQQLMAPQKEYQLYFSDLYINNEIVRPSDPTGVLKAAMPYTRNISLKHNQSNLIIRFTTTNYISPLQKTAYEYMLQGFDQKWIVTYENSIAYTNIGPGKYTLLVREWQQNSHHETHTIALQIQVHPPFYATPLFYLLYLTIGIAIIIAIFRSKQAKLLLKTSLELEKKDKEKISELNQAKLQFFANISHEFRTPLTLIISQIEILLQSSSLPPTIYNKLLKVYKNAHHMRNLISELLNFRKLEQGHVNLKVSEQNLTLFLKEIFLSFYEYAGNHSIRYTFHSSQEEIQCWFDPLQLEKVVYNLLSNAFKYVKPNAAIELHVEQLEHEIQFKVIDNGIGIKKEDIDKIFNRFYQADNEASSLASTPSTGIGLSLTKGLVELHHGSIRVESTPGYGSIFIISLLKGKNHFTPEECMPTRQDVHTVPATHASVMSDLQIEYKEMSEEQNEEEPSRTILVVEDNEELLLILDSLFAPTYKVLLARNGKEGLEMARQALPDIVVSDVMMPLMSGIEMCVKIKNDFNICHIPVVLLTALNSVEQNLEGLRTGADDYISKPFNTQLLVSRCNNLLRNRMMLKNKLDKQESFDTQLLATNPIDQKLLAQSITIIDKHLDNPEFDINLLATELCISRSSFYNKFKALTGMTPNDFVLNYKLKLAAAMLRDNPELQISDITYKLGFNTPRYFSQCFKAQFGVIPTEYRKQSLAT